MKADVVESEQRNADNEGPGRCDSRISQPRTVAAEVQTSDTSDRRRGQKLDKKRVNETDRLKTRRTVIGDRTEAPNKAWLTHVKDEREKKNSPNADDGSISPPPSLV